MKIKVWPLMSDESVLGYMTQIGKSCVVQGMIFGESLEIDIPDPPRTSAEIAVELADVIMAPDGGTLNKGAAISELSRAYRAAKAREGKK